uniref:COMM domain-containing protein n=1 Tax=Globisporangium ultimum (strain ATCC 200006 / CBS 805.95 / DAOM BR144) TaxID=431595 RepID=K3X0U5_GLOUD
MEELAEFNYSVRVNVANSALCGGQREVSVALKLHLNQTDKGEERQVMLELNETQLADLLHKFARVSKT